MLEGNDRDTIIGKPGKFDSHVKPNCFKKQISSSFLLTLISLITVEVGINVEGMQKLQNQ